MRMVPIDFPNAKEIDDREKGVTSRQNERISQGKMRPITLLLCGEGKGSAG